MGFWILIIVLVILMFLVEKIVNKFLGIEKKRVSETSGKNVDRWGKGIILVIFLCALPFVVTQDTNFIKLTWILYIIVLLGFQSILEWKYLKNSKQYVTTLIFLVLCVVFLYYLEYFL